MCLGFPLGLLGLLGLLGFDLGSSDPPTAARARSAQGASQFAAGHAAVRLASVTTWPQQAQPVNH